MIDIANGSNTRTNKVQPFTAMALCFAAVVAAAAAHFCAGIAFSTIFWMILVPC
jgi:hypothetical protein